MLTDLELVNGGVATAMKDEARREKTDRFPRIISPAKTEDAARVNQTEETAATKAAAGIEETESVSKAVRDEASLALALTQEEKAVLLAVFSEGRTPASLTPEEKDAFHLASERIQDLIDQTLTRSQSHKARIEKALEEWFSRLTQGKNQGPLDLINLFHQAASGELDRMAPPET
jgi:DUF4097 and DUF4098 domain-containing protein YvlB